MAPSVAIFPSRFKWRKLKHGRDVWSSLLAFDFYAVSGILQLRYPGSTFQSSGTLVVPSFISTYNSFGGPSVVSSLPATSSANLPVVAGGSCGGATGTEFSTFPNLNKAFVVGPGYAPVPYKLVSKITAGLFVDLADVLSDNIRAQEIEPQAFLEGKLVVSGSKKRVIEIADIVTWIEAFTIFSMILCHTFPLAGKI